MKVLSLIQPWATLVVTGKKQIETRSWKTVFRGDILIHASKKMTGEHKRLCLEEPFASALKDIEELPLGKIIGKVNIIGTIKTEDIIYISEALIPLKEGKKYSQKDWETEYDFGDYTNGRFGWLLKDPVSFTHHIAINGNRTLWDFDLRICLGCGCMDTDCQHCIEKTGEPCHWVAENLCSACVK